MPIVKSEFQLALNQVATERGISIDDVLSSIESAVLAAFKKQYPEQYEDDVITKIDRQTGETRVYKNGKDITPTGFGRIAAQTAKQVILQKIREAEKKTLVETYRSQVGNIIKGRIIRFDGRNVYVDIGRTEGIIPREEQILNEDYIPNTKISVYLKKIEEGDRTRIILSRKNPALIEQLFKREVPEIANETVSIKKVVRNPGERAKIAVYSSQSGVDPVGACVGQKGTRVQTVTDELGGKEKIDVIQWYPDTKLFIAAALSPAKIKKITVDEKNKKAVVVVDKSEAPLAIGKNGTNVNLASVLTGYEIDITQIPEKAEKEKN